MRLNDSQVPYETIITHIHQLQQKKSITLEKLKQTAYKNTRET